MLYYYALSPLPAVLLVPMQLLATIPFSTSLGQRTSMLSLYVAPRNFKIQVLKLLGATYRQCHKKETLDEEIKKENSP